MKARLRYFNKQVINERYLVELSIHEFTKTEKYPDGVRFGMFCKDLKTGDYVLIDNHYPKGPHVHINDVKLPYE